jgi:hypothetical protein
MAPDAFAWDPCSSVGSAWPPNLGMLATKDRIKLSLSELRTHHVR